MDSKRKIDVGISSALIDLKAELLKKQGELRISKAKQGPAGVKGVPKSVKRSQVLQAKSPYAKKNKGIDERSKRDEAEVKEEEKTVQLAVSILEQKAKLYDKMTSEALHYDEQEHPVLSRSLVNFTQKAIDEIQDKNSKGPQKIETATRPASDDDEEEEEKCEVNEEEWTEFTDALGRTRRCLKSDLPSFLSRDDELARPQNPGVCLSKEAEQRLIEMKRQKWEKETAETAEKVNVHYQDVLYDEIRNHGVGFYNFSKDDKVRAEQLKELKKISAETDATRQKVLKERTAKKSALQERLKKIRDKKRARLGLPPLEDKEEEVAEDEEEVEIGPMPAPSKPQEEEHREPKMRAWDFGKVGVFGPKPDTFDELDAKWLKDRRADRLSEFAPPKKY